MVLSENPIEVGPIGTLRWAFRFWLLFSIAWVAAVGQMRQYDLCAAYRWYTPKETAEHNAALAKTLAAPSLTSSAKAMFIADYDKYRERIPARACLPTSFSEDEVRQTGGYSVDWDQRASALILWLVPPFLVWLIGMSVLWALGAFRPEE